MLQLRKNEERTGLDAEQDYLSLYKPVLSRALSLAHGNGVPPFKREAFEDLYQDAWAGVERAKRNRGAAVAVDNKVAYLAHAVLNAHKQAHRRPQPMEQYPLEELSDGDPALLVEEPAFKDDDFTLQQLGAMKAILRSLPPRQRAAYVLRFTEDVNERQRARIAARRFGTLHIYKNQLKHAVKLVGTMLHKLGVMDCCDHPRVQEMIVGYRLDELDDEQRAWMRAHIEGCPVCGRAERAHRRAAAFDPLSLVLAAAGGGLTSGGGGLASGAAAKGAKEGLKATVAAKGAKEGFKALLAAKGGREIAAMAAPKAVKEVAKEGVIGALSTKAIVAVMTGAFATGGAGAVYVAGDGGAPVRREATSQRSPGKSTVAEKTETKHASAGGKKEPARKRSKRRSSSNAQQRRQPVTSSPAPSAPAPQQQAPQYVAPQASQSPAGGGGSSGGGGSGGGGCGDFEPIC